MDDQTLRSIREDARNGATLSELVKKYFRTQTNYYDSTTSKERYKINGDIRRAKEKKNGFVHRVQFLLPTETVQKIDQVCKTKGTNRTHYISQLINRDLNQKKE